jgi:hypothetical protein
MPDAMRMASSEPLRGDQEWEEVDLCTEGQEGSDAEDEQ